MDESTDRFDSLIDLELTLQSTSSDSSKFSEGFKVEPYESARSDYFSSADTQEKGDFEQKSGIRRLQTKFSIDEFSGSSSDEEL